MPKDRLPRLYFVSEVAEVLRIHPSNVRRLIRQGRLPAHRLGDRGSRWRVSEASITRLLLDTMIGGRWLVRSYPRRA